MLQGGFSSRSITNRAYYSMFYAVLALFLKADMRIKTSKHIGVISIFDKEFILAGKIDKYYSEILHRMFNIRQKVDYRELIEIAIEEAAEYVRLAKEFIEYIKNYVDKIPTQ
jgi:uncharacterized protein (UPF0332 family)